MEDVLEVYRRPYNPLYPVVCMDEQPVQLISECRKSLPLKPGSIEKYDYEYERMGSTNNFLFTDPNRGWRRVSVRDRKTGVDWAEEIKELVDIDYPSAKTITLVCDNLVTHRLGSLYERYPPEEARRLVSRLDLRFTPKHGSWLNIAEIELSVLTKQCLDRYIPDSTTLREKVSAWTATRNNDQKGVDWKFTAADARVRLKRLYPRYQTDLKGAPPPAAP